MSPLKYRPTIILTRIVMVILLDQYVLGMAINYKNTDWSLAEVTLNQKRLTESEHLHVQVKTFGKTHDLELIQAPKVFSPKFEEYVAVTDNDGSQKIHKRATNASEHHNFVSQLFTNAEGSASLFVHTHDGEVTLEGILNDDLYISKDVRQVRSSDSTIRHIAFKRNLESAIECFAKPPTISRASSLDSASAINSQRVPDIIQPEIFLVIEYQISKYFNHDLYAIKKYLGIFFNSVNRRYATLKSLKIRHVICGLLQITTVSTEDSFKVQDFLNYVNDEQILSNFGKWLYNLRELRTVTTNYDIAMWMTTQKLYQRQPRLYTTLGISYVQGACDTDTLEEKFYKVGLVKDNPGKYSGIRSMAHELGHLLGAWHDGQAVPNPHRGPGSEDCPFNDGYLMSYKTGNENQFYFSSCSEKEFDFFIHSPDASCLWDTPTSVVTLNDSLPGTLISLDDQCKSKLGDGYIYRKRYYEEVCDVLPCFKRAMPGVFVWSRLPFPALEGSPCNAAQTKWCINGECVTKNQLPSS